MLANQMNRRHFLTHVAGASALTMCGGHLMNGLLAAPDNKLKDKHLIVLWMGGGPSHMDLWDIKTDSNNKGEFNAIDTAAPGVKISEVLPTVAQQMKNLAIIRSINSREGDHNRGTFKMTHGFPPSALGVNIPGIGSIAGYFLGSDDVALPRVVSVGGNQIGDAGFLGASMAGFPVQNAGQVPENMKLPQMGNPQETNARGKRRQNLLNVLEDGFTARVAPEMELNSEKRKKLGDAAQAHKELYSRAFEVSMKSGPQVFEFNTKDNEIMRKNFGMEGGNGGGNMRGGGGGFSRSAFLASKLIQNGVTAVQINLGGWDMHNGIFNAIKNNQGPALDKAMGGLVKHLDEIGKLKDTVVVWMGDFGRTPRINQNAGRDHWSNGWSVVLGGGKIKGGQTYGSTGKDGTGVEKDGVTVEELYATLYTALGIDLTDNKNDLHDNLGRRYYIAGDKKNAAPVKALLA